MTEEEPIVMLCEEGSLEDLKRQGFASELKLDGTRVKIVKQKGKVTLINRRQIIYTARLPEITEAVKAMPADNFILDSEIVYVNPATGKSEFTPCQSLLGQTSSLSNMNWEYVAGFLDGDGSIEAKYRQKIKAVAARVTFYNSNLEVLEELSHLSTEK
jgi:ATP-dependent DNA ligase